MSFNLAAILRESSNTRPDKPLCHPGEHTFTYAQVDEISGRIATSLRALGVGRGDKVVVQLPNMPHFLFAYFGILKVGAVLVPLNPLLRAPEICYHLINCDAKLLITFEASAEEAVRGAAEIDGMPTYVVKAPINAHLPAGTHHFDELYFAEGTAEIEPTEADDTAVIVYTSGTTGKPKGVQLTHFQLYISCTGAGELFGFRDEDIGMAVQPLLAPISTFNVNAEHYEMLSIGKPIRGVQVRVVGADGKELPLGPEYLGEIVVRGHQVMKGYHNDSKATAGVFRNDWLYTGDLGYRDEDGDLFVVGRKNGIVSHGRHNSRPG